VAVANESKCGAQARAGPAPRIVALTEESTVLYRSLSRKLSGVTSDALRRSIIRGVLCLVILDVAWTFWLPEVRNKFALRASGHPQNLPNQDFIAYYTAGLAFRTGHNPYRDNGNIDARLADPGVGGYSRFKYPPAALPFWAFVSRADYDAARKLWVGLCAMAYLATLGMVLWTSEPVIRWNVLIAAGLLTVSAYTIIEEVQHGQIDLIVSGLGVSGFVLHCMGRRALSAALLAGATVIKVNPAILLIYFVIFRRDIRYVFWFAAWMIGALSVSVLSVPVDLYVQFARDVLPVAAAGTTGFHNQSLIRLVGGHPRLAGIVSLIGLASFAVLARVLSRRDRATAAAARIGPAGPVLLWRVMFLLNVLAMLLFSGLAWHMTLSWIILPASALLAHWLANTPPERAATQRPHLVLLVLGFSLMTGTRLWDAPGFNALGLIGAAGLSIVLIFAAWQLTSPITDR